MLLFYVLAGVLALLTALAIVRPLAQAAPGPESRAARDAALYRDQLEEIERDLDRGVISEDEAEGARAEISRRLIAAASRAESTARPGAAPRRYSGLMAGIAVVGAPALAVAVYLSVGAPGLPDLPLAERLAAGAAAGTRLSQAAAEAELGPETPPPSRETEEYATLIGRLETVLEQRPGDPRGLQLLAAGYARLGRYGEAWRTYEKLIAAKGDDATAEDHAAMAETMVLAAGGYVSAEAERAIDAALTRDPESPVARYYRGLALAQAGSLDEAVAVWEDLRAESPPDAPWLGFLDRTLAEVRAVREGETAGPSAAEIAAAEQLSPAEREAMVEGMISRLESRLTTEGGTAEEWLRLMNAYVQLGRREEAARVAALGIEAFGNSSEADFLREQALLMGLEPQ